MLVLLHDVNSKTNKLLKPSMRATHILKMLVFSSLNQQKYAVDFFMEEMEFIGVALIDYKPNEQGSVAQVSGSLLYYTMMNESDEIMCPGQTLALYYSNRSSTYRRVVSQYCTVQPTTATARQQTFPLQYNTVHEYIGIKLTSLKTS